MKSVRLDENLERRLQEASSQLGRSQSDIIREAVGNYCDSVGGGRLDLRLAPFLGIVHGGGGRARRTGEAFTEELVRRRAERKDKQS